MDVKRLSIKVAVSGVKSNSHIIYKTWSNTIDGDGAQWLSLAIGTHGRGDIVDIVGNSYRSITPINDLHVPIAGPSPSKNFFKAFILSYLPHSKKTCIGHNLAIYLLCSPYLLYFCLTYYPLKLCYFRPYKTRFHSKMAATGNGFSWSDTFFPH